MNPRTLHALASLAAHKLELERANLAAARAAEDAQRERLLTEQRLLANAAALHPEGLGFGAWRNHGIFLSESIAHVRTEEIALQDRSRAVARAREATMTAVQARDIIERMRQLEEERMRAAELAAERKFHDELSGFHAAVKALSQPRS
jgi:flagellar biosynthesis chaperone FliJ